jgi:hypothetical protein
MKLESIRYKSLVLIISLTGKLFPSVALVGGKIRAEPIRDPCGIRYGEIRFTISIVYYVYLVYEVLVKLYIDIPGGHQLAPIPPARAPSRFQAHKRNLRIDVRGSVGKKMFSSWRPLIRSMTLPYLINNVRRSEI